MFIERVDTFHFNTPTKTLLWSLSFQYEFVTRLKDTIWNECENEWENANDFYKAHFKPCWRKFSIRKYVLIFPNWNFFGPIHNSTINKRGWMYAIYAILRGLQTRVNGPLVALLRFRVALSLFLIQRKKIHNIKWNLSTIQISQKWFHLISFVQTYCHSYSVIELNFKLQGKD